jgi:hypothetical protein
MGKIIRLTESQLKSLVKRVIEENEDEWPDVESLDFLAKKTFKFTYDEGNGMDYAKTNKTIKKVNLFKVDTSYFSPTAGGPIIKAENGKVDITVLPIDEYTGKIIEIPKKQNNGTWGGYVETIYTYDCKTNQQSIMDRYKAGGTPSPGKTQMGLDIVKHYCSKRKVKQKIKTDYSRTDYGMDNSEV